MKQSQIKDGRSFLWSGWKLEKIKIEIWGFSVSFVTSFLRNFQAARMIFIKKLSLRKWLEKAFKSSSRKASYGLFSSFRRHKLNSMTALCQLC